MLKKKTFLIKKIFLTILPISIAACSLDSIKNKFSNNQPKETQIRIVGLDGEYRPINRQIPALNSNLLISQQQNPIQNNSEEAAKKENANSQNLNSLDNFGPSDQPLLESSNLSSASAAAIIYNSNQEKQSATKEESEAETAEKKLSQKIYIIEKKPAIPTGTFIQIGSFRSKNNAEKALAKSKNIANGLIKEAGSNKKIYKIILGPVNNKVQANSLLKKAKNNGFKDAFITKIK
ncbi:SPOR domain-containing protein [Rickettsiales bacterium]|nr:SPOR domain-containing protein [Rickettsiales bacterium]